MNKALFRKSSIDRMNSPEQLNEYIRVANPGVWVTLAAVIVLLLGMLGWAAFGTIETTLNAVAVTRGGETICYLSEEDARKVQPGQAVTIGEVQGAVQAITPAPLQLTEDADSYALYAGGFEVGDYCFVAEIAADGLEDGAVNAAITLESIHPLKFIVQ